MWLRHLNERFVSVPQGAKRRGRKAEDEAARWLEGQGWEILAQRRKTKVGEIDLVAKREGLVAFVEVKWRQRAADLDLAIDEYRLSRVAAAAESVAHERGVEHLGMPASKLEAAET